MVSKFRIDQVLPSYSQHDAIGTHVHSIEGLLKARGFESAVFATENRRDDRRSCGSIEDHQRISGPSDLTIYHHSTGSSLPYYLAARPGRKICLYHNITPFEFFESVGDFVASATSRSGILDLELVGYLADDAWTPSYYNTKDLLRVGFKDPKVFPILRDYQYLSELSPDMELRSSLMDERRINILFVGRIAPNKCQHDLLILAKICRELTGQRARIIMIGSQNPEYFLRKIEPLCHAWQLTIARGKLDRDALAADVLIPGQIDDQALASFYGAADYFVSMSEHEGFCVPLVEAMFFGKPIIAHDACAVGETLGQGGLLVDKTNKQDFCREIAEILTSPEKKRALELAARERSKDFTKDRLEASFDRALDASLAVLV